MLGAVLGGIAGLLTGGTAMAAAVGAGLGRIASGGDLEDALKDGALAFGIGSILQCTSVSSRSSTSEMRGASFSFGGSANFILVAGATV